MTPEEHLAETRRVYARVYDEQVHREAAGAQPGYPDTWDQRHAVQTQMMADAQLHTSMAIAQMLAEMPVCDHGARGFCHDCMKMTLIEMGFDEPN